MVLRTNSWEADSIEALGIAIGNVLGKGTGVPEAENTFTGPLERDAYFSFPPSRVSPRLSYGRHRGPARINSRRAAVTIVIYPHRQTGQLCLTLTRRPITLAHHGGQICLPGGRVENGESAIQAALREYDEELGVTVDLIDDLGRLPPIYVFASDNIVDTVVVTAAAPPDRWRPDPVEVEEVIEMPLACLLELGPAEASGRPPRASQSTPPDLETSRQAAVAEIFSQKRTRSGKVRDSGAVFRYSFGCRAIRFVDCEGHGREIWGATAMLIDQFADVLRRAAAWSD
jgi:8-oxo-dGTP pyrophosphatase MutT (NUDIX family)